MYKTNVKIEAFEPRFVTIELDTQKELETQEAIDMALAQLEEQYPELVDPIVGEVTRE